MSAPAAATVHLTPGNKSTRNRQDADPDRAPWSHRRRERPQLLLPAVAVHRDRRDPRVAAAEQHRRSELKRAAAAQLRRALADTPPGAPIGHLRVSDADRLWLYRRAAALDDCHEVRAFREAQCGQYDVMPISCRVRICPDCERARAARVVRIVRAILDQVPARRRSFIVLTIRNVATLDAGLDELARAYGSLRGRSLFRGGKCRWRLRDGSPGHPCSSSSCRKWTCKHHGPDRRACWRPRCRHRSDRNCPDFRHRDAVAGGGAFYEVTGGPGDWHPHANLLLDAPFIAQAELADTWRASTCSDPRHRRAGWCPSECDGGSPIVWIERVNPRTVREAVKYVTKSAELVARGDPDALVEFMLATRGRRMVQGWGSFYGLELVESDDAGETVNVAVDTGQHDSAGRAVVIRYKLPRWCRQCGRDTANADGTNTYEPPIIVPRDEVALRNGLPVWRGPAPPSGPAPGGVS